MNVLRDLQMRVGQLPGVSPVRKAVLRAAAMPWERQTLFDLSLAQWFPKFSRGHDNEAAATADMRVVRDYTMTKYDRCAVLHNLARHMEVTGVEGAFAELGVWRGGSMGIMALASRRYGKTPRTLHLFDAWDNDWPDPTPEDGFRFNQLKQGVLKKADNDGAEAACRRLLESDIGYDPNLIHYHRGLFEDTVPKVDMGPLALLRLDCDWYEPMKFSMEQLYDSVSPGGAVVFDDYGYCEGAKKAVDEFFAARGETPFIHYVDYSCRYVIKA